MGHDNQTVLCASGVICKHSVTKNIGSIKSKFKNMILPIQNILLMSLVYNTKIKNVIISAHSHAKPEVSKSCYFLDGGTGKKLLLPFTLPINRLIKPHKG